MCRAGEACRRSRPCLRPHRSPRGRRRQGGPPPRGTGGRRARPRRNRDKLQFLRRAVWVKTLSVSPRKKNYRYIYMRQYTPNVRLRRNQHKKSLKKNRLRRETRKKHFACAKRTPPKSSPAAKKDPHIFFRDGEKRCGTGKAWGAAPCPRYVVKQNG